MDEKQNKLEIEKMFALIELGKVIGRYEFEGIKTDLIIEKGKIKLVIQ